jgi:hypothetical protein
MSKILTAFFVAASLVATPAVAQMTPISFEDWGRILISAGPAGPPRPQGLQCPAGATGSQGTAGVADARDLQGAAGRVGRQVPQGPADPVEPQDPQGPAGIGNCDPPPLSGARTFYLRNGGNDNADGLSDATAWATLAKVQNYADTVGFSGGDSVLLRGGDVFEGALNLGAGDIVNTTALSPFRIGRYGVGYPTLMATGGSAMAKTAAIMFDQTSHVVVEDLKLRVSAAGAGMVGSGVFIRNSHPTTEHTNFTVQRIDAQGFTAPARTDAATEGAHIYYECSGQGGLSDLKFFDNILHGADPSSQDFGGIKGWGKCFNIVARGNHVWNMGSQNVMANHASGILLNHVNRFGTRAGGGGLAEYNLVHDIGANWDRCGGPVGIWAHASDSVVIQFNEAFRVRSLLPKNVRCDENGIGLDAGGAAVTNNVVQYNYSHDNGGSGFYHWGDGSSTNNIFRFNISANNNQDLSTSFGEFSFNGRSGAPTGHVEVYNNVLFATPSSKQQKAVFVFQGLNAGMPAATSIIANNVLSQAPGQFGTASMINGNQNTPLPQWRNNIHHVRSTSQTPIRYMSWGGGAAQNQHSSYAAWAAVSGETGGLNTNPLFVGPGTEPADFALQPTSPAIGAGVPVDLPAGFMDFYGTVVSPPFNIGAWEGGSGPIIMLSGLTVPTGAAQGTDIGTFSVANSPGGTWTFRLVTHAMERVRLSGTTLQVATQPIDQAYLWLGVQATNGSVTLKRYFRVTPQ